MYDILYPFHRQTTVQSNTLHGSASSLDPNSTVSLQKPIPSAQPVSISTTALPTSTSITDPTTPSLQSSTSQNHNIDDIDDGMPLSSLSSSSSLPPELKTFADDDDEIIDPLAKEGNQVIGYDDDDHGDDDDDDDSDDLIRELEKIREERHQQEIMKIKQEAKINANVNVMDNPLLRDKLEEITKGITEDGDMNHTHSVSQPMVLGVKRWQDDAVFTNQAAGLNPRGDYQTLKKQRFINDTTKSDFHREFLSTYFK